MLKYIRRSSRGSTYFNIRLKMELHQFKNWCLKQNNENEITFPSQSVKVNGEKLPENKVADFYVEEKDKGGKVLSSNLKIKDLKSHEK